jgi:endoglucanase
MQTVLPRWRGFNVHNMFHSGRLEPFREDDFRWIADWGFDYVRISVAYQQVVTDGDCYRANERGLAEVDRGLALARKYDLHACLDMHTAPGYAYHESEDVGGFDLWKDEEAQRAFCHLWQVYAKRYRGIPNTQLSFNLLNEPALEIGKMTREEHANVIRKVTAAIREVMPDRLMIADGLEWASEPCPELADLGIAQSGHFYAPHLLTHYRASWGGPEVMKCPEPAWPGTVTDGKRWDRSVLEEHLRPWFALADRGVGVHFNEGGVYSKTPHPVALAWLRDTLELLKEHKIGYGVWNFRGPFGILDSGRAGVEYQDFHGHKLDRKMLEVLQAV